MGFRRWRPGWQLGQSNEALGANKATPPGYAKVTVERWSRPGTAGPLTECSDRSRQLFANEDHIQRRW